MNFDDIIHAERAKLLRQLPKGAKTVCSAGAAGAWYFDWFEENYGKVDLHYGVELYLEKPSLLPSNVVWIENSVSNMCDVPSASVDLLFSGQNIEHLYYRDLLGFLREANRVVKPGGYICMDSPNRLITQEIRYLQPQHVLEFTVEDASRLLEAAGYTIESTCGIWSCVIDGRRYADVTTVTSDFQDRRTRALNDPNDSFVWWIIARKTDECISLDFEKRVQQAIVRKFSPFVVSRFTHALGSLWEYEGTRSVLKVDWQDEGCVFYGPNIPLTAGDFVAQFTIKFLSGNGAITLRVTADDGRDVLSELSLHPSDIGRWVTVDLPFSLSEYRSGIETPLFSHWSEALVQFGTQIYRR